MANRTVVTLVGKDHTGIIAAVCNYFAENDINIQNLSMTTVEDYINMMLIVDLDRYKKTFPELTADLDEIAQRQGCSIKAQHEDIFNMMHRI